MSKKLLTYRILFAVLAQYLRSNPTFGAWDSRPAAKTVPADSKLLAEAKVGDHGFYLAMGIRHRDEDVVGLQVSVD